MAGQECSGSEFNWVTLNGEDDFGMGVLLLKCFLKRESLVFFTVNDDKAVLGTMDILGIGEEFIPIGVPAIRIDPGDVSLHGEGFSEDIYLLVTPQDFESEGVLGTVTDKEDGVFLIADVVAEMVKNSPGLAHS